MNYKILLYYNSGKSHLRIISRNAALPVPMNDDLLKADNNAHEFSVSYENIDEVMENLDTIISEAVESISVDGSAFGVSSYQILTAESEHSVGEYYEKNCDNFYEEEKKCVNDILASIYKIVGS